MATVNQAVVNSPLDAPAKARDHLMVRRRKVVNKVTESFFPIFAVSWSLLLIFKYVQNDIAHANETEPGAFFLSQMFLHGLMKRIFKGSMLLSILDISISPMFI